MRPRLRTLLLCLLLPVLSGCDALLEALEIPNPAKDAAKVEAEGQAIGSACRHAGRSLEDCYILNPEAQKAAVFAGWRAMNDYMMEHKLDVVPSQLPAHPSKPAPAPAEPEHKSEPAAEPARTRPAGR
ncbi:hypothetical protein [Parazoarcus communis]|uniref:Uncharacterized protein n=1 Tax=Parazoarcus communis SWub3 = DSM 12120 TaxID=1121029 RepID=A0A323V3Q2_9RHOO|nr:hypothetical protein [Parazoarcus communis]NMG69772.1 hypothetical protein [Parazoarcus communis SWub3 = DSM 12120]PZA18066.1 hypothetical protein DNK49_00530 [Azoarcus communis] [Parazoarcus communis SWub3 = DSM 12120]